MATTNVNETSASKELAELLLSKGEQLQKAHRQVPAVAWIDLPDSTEKLLLIGDDAPREYKKPRFEQHAVHTVADLAAQAVVELGKQVDGDTSAQPQIWYTENEVLLLHTGDEPRHWSRLPLFYRSAWGTTLGMIAHAPDQQGMLGYLRGPLKGALYAAPPDFEALEGESTLQQIDLVKEFRGLNFSKAARSESDIQQTRETFGRDVEQQITGAGELPEEIVVRAPVYEQLDYQGTLRLALTVRFEEQRFKWSPVGDCLREAREGAMTALRGLLTAALGAAANEIPIYRGAPQWVMDEDE